MVYSSALLGHVTEQGQSDFAFALTAAFQCEYMQAGGLTSYEYESPTEPALSPPHLLSPLSVLLLVPLSSPTPPSNPGPELCPLVWSLQYQSTCTGPAFMQNQVLLGELV